MGTLLWGSKDMEKQSQNKRPMRKGEIEFQRHRMNQVWWHLGEWRQEDRVQGQSWLHDEFNHVLHFGALDRITNVMSEAFP